MRRLCAVVRGESGWRRNAIALVAGALSVLAMAPFFATAVLALTLPVLVWLIDGSGMATSPRVAARSAAIAGWWFGFGYFILGLFWVGEAFLVEADKFAWALPFAVTLLPGGLALFFALAAGAARLYWPGGIARVLVLAVTLSACEWLRGHVLTGFPWNVLGYALTDPLELMQAAGLVGIYGLTLWTVLLLAAPLVLAAEPRAATAHRLSRWRGFALAAVGLAALSGYGRLVLSQGPTELADGVRLRIVQPSVPQREKWLPEMQGRIFSDHLDLSRRDGAGRVDGLAGITHVVWPEAAMPFLPLSRPEALAAIGELLPDGVHLLTGALRLATDSEAAAHPPPNGRRAVYNSLLVFGPSGELAARYDKTHLVPFGEYLPVQDVLEGVGLRQLTQMRGGFAIGEVPRPLVEVPGLPLVGGLICYEAIFPAAVVQADRRPGVLVNVTNDGWFGNTTGPHQHFHQARVRAVEEGVALVRAANNGISAVVDPFGRVLATIGLNARGVIDTGLPLPRPPPPYARLGDVLFALNLVAFLAAMLWLRPVFDGSDGSGGWPSRGARDAAPDRRVAGPVGPQVDDCRART
ncbi:MAG: apolipoprotein N-acyltransferase [Pseudomonadota bacterium]